ncbi:unnamed protein product [Triticum turgidum subsp. durum]|uniref:SAM-dependent methyltransferase TRM5/TYW2-type domain-containing protein n=1 Tax=Triticum turgidum subsp. durum TaxID=4567 RepID=A0A9R0VJW4_TRITD|nr:unnamed protein product [Triticum turgidum subsp. durum]
MSRPAGRTRRETKGRAAGGKETKYEKDKVYVVEVLEQGGEDDEDEWKGLVGGEGFGKGAWRGEPTRLLLLDEGHAKRRVDELPEAVKVVLEHEANQGGPFAYELVQCQLTLFYDYWPMNERCTDLGLLLWLTTHPQQPFLAGPSPQHHTGAAEPRIWVISTPTQLCAPVARPQQPPLQAQPAHARPQSLRHRTVTLPLQIQDSGKTSTCSGRFNCHYTGSVSSCGNVQLLVQRCVHRKCDQYIFLRHSIGKKKDMVLEALLPEGIIIPAGFETVGHIAHLNLRDEHLPYKTLIAHVIFEYIMVVLDKNKPKIQTVVNKIDAIQNDYRTMQLEILAGHDSLVTTVIESGLRFQVDLATVYWNSRLSTERQRLVNNIFQNSDVVCDVFSGVGPIAISAAKKVKYVYANDLNPAAVEYLEQNIVLNKLERKIEVIASFTSKYARVAQVHLFCLSRSMWEM